MSLRTEETTNICSRQGSGQATYATLTMSAHVMRAARIRGALVGIESVTPEGLKDVYKDFNLSGDELAAQLQKFKAHGVHVLGSFGCA